MPSRNVNSIVPSRTFIGSKTKDKIMGIGLNGKPTLSEVAKQVIPSQLKILAGGVLASGAWLNLGNEPGVDERDQIVNGQSNMGLTAALLVTVQFAFMFVLPDIRETMFERSWIVNALEPGMDDVLYEVMMSANISAIIIGCMCMVYSVFIILMCGEMTGGAEITLLSNLMGWRINGSIILFLLSIAITACNTFLFALCACLSLEGVISMLIQMAVVVVVILILFFGPLIQSGILAKALNASNTPLCLSKSQVEALFQEFCATVAEDGEYVTQESFEDYLALLVREKDIKLGRTETFLGEEPLKPHQHNLESAVLSVMSVSGVTRELAKNCVEEYLASHAQFSNDKEQIVLTTSECEEMVRSHASKVGDQRMSPANFMHFVDSQVFEVQDIKDLDACAAAEDSGLTETAKVLVRKIQEIHKQKEAELAGIDEGACVQQKKSRKFEIAYISRAKLQKAVSSFCQKLIDDVQ
mmetsp:Transcript_17481/g.42672  ORF Transcript_17481/g.42672 Transcript_17481/m.42672 type:complete len:470 (-) Transcript_17481:106-1515(-)